MNELANSELIKNTQVPQKALWALKSTVKKMICYGKHHHPFKWGSFQD